MKSRGIVFGIVCMVMLLATGSLQAEIKSGAISLNPSVGGYVFEGDQDLESSLLYGLGLGYHLTKNWAVEGIFNYVNTETDPGGADVDGYLYRLEGLFHFLPDNRLVPFVAAGLGGITLDPAGGTKDSDFLANYGGGVKYFINEMIAIRGDIRHVIPFDDVQNNLAVTLGLSFLFGGEKRAPAAVKTEAAKREVAAEAQVATAQVQLDSDGDGVLDAADKCPNTPKGVAVDEYGCPPDADGDGVIDAYDQCFNTPAGVAVDKAGCPLDTDGDGVYDYRDRCPGTAAGVPVDNVGCPLDSDGDGVYDYMDKCPGTPADLTVDPDGCPILQKEKVSIELLIEFDVDKTYIKPKYHSQIKKVADFMQTYPNTEAVIEGHTDSTGSDAYNLDLSRRRAESVQNYLINNLGIASQRLSTKWYGEKQPVASNATAEGRQRNRRVLAIIVTIKEAFEKK